MSQKPLDVGQKLALIGVLVLVMIAFEGLTVWALLPWYTTLILIQIIAGTALCFGGLFMHLVAESADDTEQRERGTSRTNGIQNDVK